MPPVNPLTGEPLQPGQTLVTGPPYTGPRQTVVWLARPETWPRWIEMGPLGVPFDRGTIAGGTWDGRRGVQTLPDVTVTEPRRIPWIVVAVLAVFGLAMYQGRGTRVW